MLLPTNSLEEKKQQQKTTDMYIRLRAQDFGYLNDTTADSEK